MKTIKIAFDNTISTVITNKVGIKAIMSLINSMNCNCEIYELDKKGFKLIKRTYQLKNNKINKQ